MESREAITAYLEQKIIAGDVKDRAGLVAALHDAGIETPREGKSYVTALDPESGERWRLKGRIYEKDWTRGAEFDRAAARDDAKTAERAGGIDGDRAAKSRERLKAIIARRAEWVRERYPDPDERTPAEREIKEGGDRGRLGRDPRKAETLDSDQRSDGSPDLDPVLGRADAVDDVAAQRRDGGDQRDWDVSDSSRNSGAGLALWRAALRKIGGLNDREVDGDRASALGRIRELGIRVRDFGTSAVSALRAFFVANQSVGRPAEQARDAFEASKRSLGTAEQVNDHLDREIAAVERRIELTEKLASLDREIERQRDHQLTR